MLDTMKPRTWAQIDLDAAEHNLRGIRDNLQPGTKICAVVKADAYGHGAVPVARALVGAGADWLGVSSVEEALQLRHADVTTPILVLGYTLPENMPALCEYGITQTIVSEEYAKLLSETARAAGKPIRAHIKLDTGMNRIGLAAKNERELYASVKQIERIVRMDGLVCEGVFTHFASADDRRSQFTEQQFYMFKMALDKLAQRGIGFEIRHACNSAATLNFPHMQLDMVRPGLILYGLYPGAPTPQQMRAFDLTPVMSLMTRIAQIHQIGEGQTVSYGRTYKSYRPTTIATLPIGYADGFSRLFSNNAEVYVNGRLAPVIGRVCMDMSMIDVTGIDGVREGDTATIFDGRAIPVERLAELMETINFEVVCLIGKRVPRIYTRGEDVVGVLNYIV